MTSPDVALRRALNAATEYFRHEDGGFLSEQDISRLVEAVRPFLARPLTRERVQMEPEWRYHDRSDQCPVSPEHEVQRERYLGGTVLCRAKDAYWPNTVRYRDWTAFEQQQAKGEVPENPPAFPTHDGDPGTDPRSQILTGGMSLRDWWVFPSLAMSE